MTSKPDFHTTKLKLHQYSSYTFGGKIAKYWDRQYFRPYDSLIESCTILWHHFSIHIILWIMSIWRRRIGVKTAKCGNSCWMCGIIYNNYRKVSTVWWAVNTYSSMVPFIACLVKHWSYFFLYYSVQQSPPYWHRYHYCSVWCHTSI